MENRTTLQELRDNETWEEAVIVFKLESFNRPFTEEERSYKFTRNNKYFNPNANGNSLFGNCLDGRDNDVRLDIYMHRLPEEGTRWLEDYCYITK